MRPGTGTSDVPVHGVSPHHRPLTVQIQELVSLPRAEHECHQVGLVCGSEVNFGAETP